VILLLIAPPGAGKGTQAARLAAHYRINRLSSGEILRNEVASGTAVGRLVAAPLARGDLVPDELVVELMAGRLLEAERAGGCVLDGFPRSVAQAELTEQLLAEHTVSDRPLALHLDVGEQELRRRLLARAVTEERNDDTETTVTHRLELYTSETAPLLDFYAARGALLRVDGEQPVDEAFAAIVAAVDGAPARR